MRVKRIAGRRIVGGTPLLVKGALALILLSRAASGFHVSPDGDDANPGSKAEPFATIGRARKAVRQLIARGLDADVRVLVRAGAYYLPEGLVFGPDDSGTDRFRVTYAAYPGEVPVLVGGVRLTRWNRYKGRIVVAEIPGGLRPGQLFEDGRRMPLARAPNTGYFHLERPLTGKEHTDFVYRAGELDPRGWDTSGARVFIWPGHDWFSQDKPIARIDREARVVTMGTRHGYAMKPGNRYFVKNVLALLDAPGECMIDLDRHKVYAWPRKEPVGARTMVASTAEALITVRGSDGRPVRNLHFEGFDLSIADGDAVKITDAEDPENPKSMDRILARLGIKTIDWSYKTDCCGASHVIARQDVVFRLVGKLYQKALEAGANCIVVSCQMCQANLDMYQDKIGKELGTELYLPIIYFTELIGLAMGDRGVDTWLSRHFVDPRELVKRLEAERLEAEKLEAEKLAKKEKAKKAKSQ